MLSLITIASAATIYSGDSYTFPSEEFEYYTIVGNQSSLEGLEVNWENGNTTITFDNLYSSDKFTIVLFNEKEVVVQVHVGGGGGGGRRTIYKDRNITNTVVKEILKELAGDTEIITKISEVEVERFPFWARLVLITLSILVIFLIVKLFISKQTESVEEEGDQNEI